MLKQNPVILPGESRAQGAIFLRRNAHIAANMASARTAIPHGAASATSAMSAQAAAAQGTQRAQVAQGAQGAQGAQSMRMMRDVDLMQVALRDEYNAGLVPTDTSQYLMATLKGVMASDDASVLDPSGGIASSRSAMSHIDQTTAAMTDATSTLTTTAAAEADAAVQGVSQTVGKTSVSDSRIFIDSLRMQAALVGFPDGIVAAQFSDLNGTSPPERVIQMHLAPFLFPHIYNASTDVFDTFYFRTVFLSMRFTPVASAFQVSTPNIPFTFELAVEDIDSSAVLLVPREPTLYFSQPINVTSDLTMQFFTRRPDGTGFAGCPIPPLRILVTRTGSIAVPPTTSFRIIDGTHIGALAPDSAPYTVPVMFRPYNAVTTALETALVNATGYQSSNFNAAAGTFDVAVDTTLIGAGADDIYLFVPKNSFAMSARFTSTQYKKTTDMVAIHL